MIQVRDVFRLKYGQARPAVALFKEGLDLGKKAGAMGSYRLLTDLVGPAYTIVLESTHESLAAFEKNALSMSANDEWRKWYQKFTPHVESGYREIFNVVE